MTEFCPTICDILWPGQDHHGNAENDESDVEYGLGQSAQGSFFFDTQTTIIEL
jgi:hypothetical protein